MKKFKIITLSIFLLLVITIALLFGFVFRLRQIDIVGDLPDGVTAEQVKSNCRLKYGESIFMLDKDSSTNKLEKLYPYIKIEQIKTVSVLKVEIIVSTRQPLFETHYANNYLVLDKQLKVLSIAEESQNLINIDSKLLNISVNTVAGESVDKQNLSLVTNNLYYSLLNTVKIEDNYVEYNDILTLITDVKLDTGYTKTERYTRLILKTSYGVTVDIGKPEQDLQNKINLCFGAIGGLSPEEKASGTIKYYYLSDGTATCGYFSADQTAE